MSAFTKRTLLGTLLGLVLTVIFYQLGAYPSLQAVLAPERPFDEAPVSTLEQAEERLRLAAAKPDQSSEMIVRLYRTHLGWDIPFFLATGLLCSALLMLTIGPGRPRKVIALAVTLPLLAATFDAIENGALATWFCGDGPTETSVRVAYCATYGKFSAFLAMSVMLVVALLARFLQCCRGG